MRTSYPRDMCRTSGLLRWSLLLLMLKDAALAYKCSEVTDTVFDEASECVLKTMHPTMLEAFGKSQPSAITDSGMPDLQRVKQAWNESCTPQANSISSTVESASITGNFGATYHTNLTELLVPSQSDEDKVTLAFMVETCLNSTIFTAQFAAAAAK